MILYKKMMKFNNNYKFNRLQDVNNCSNSS